MRCFGTPTGAGSANSYFSLRARLRSSGRDALLASALSSYAAAAAATCGNGSVLTAIRHWRIMECRVELIETSTFTKQITALLTDEEYGEFQSRLAANPGLGALIKGGGGIRKTRVAIGSRGKRGGARVIYYWAVRKNVILLLYAYAKNAL